MWVQLQATPRPRLEIAVDGARMVGDDALLAHGRLLRMLADDEHSCKRSSPGAWTVANSALGTRDLLRVAWPNALLVEVYRTGAVMPGSPLAGARLRDPEELLALATEPDLDELFRLAELARERLLPRLHDFANIGPTRLAPIFIGSRLMKADADLIVGQTLVELKTTLGSKTGTARRASLDGRTLY